MIPPLSVAASVGAGVGFSAGPHALMASEAVNANAAARPMRWVAAGTALFARFCGSAPLQNGQLASASRT